MWPEHNAYKKNIDGGSGGFKPPVECYTNRVSGLSGTRNKFEGQAMGCKICDGCGEKFEAYVADEYAGDNAEPNYDTCPDCLIKDAGEVKHDAEVSSMRAELQALRTENTRLQQTLNKRSASVVIDLTEGSNSPKKRKTETGKQVWVLAKGDWPSHRAQLVDVDILGTYSTEEKASAAKEQYLEEGDWMEGYGYHQGEDGESTIDIFETTIDAPAV
jgi:hypothetical protein